MGSPRSGAGVRRRWNSCRSSATYCEWVKGKRWECELVSVGCFSLCVVDGCRSKLQLLEWVSSEAVTSILHKLIEQRMEQHCRGEYERSFLLEFQEVKQPARPSSNTFTFVSCSL